ncbi:hypothetical protein PanWU01x14_356120 [Parasponia andersonii]|uniref:Uncharacterized protein n=1 Tax=Parasponia andersonii TaxID=3476 RepID=A0A2P5A908_PARAD|nr:hypothetical protein PanWU01x14_356120 [Parasponia andersonii]
MIPVRFLAKPAAAPPPTLKAALTKIETESWFKLEGRRGQDRKSFDIGFGSWLGKRLENFFIRCQTGSFTQIPKYLAFVCSVA